MKTRVIYRNNRYVPQVKPHWWSEWHYLYTDSGIIPRDFEQCSEACAFAKKYREDYVRNMWVVKQDKKFKIVLYYGKYMPMYKRHWWSPWRKIYDGCRSESLNHGVLFDTEDQARECIRKFKISWENTVVWAEG